MFAELGFVPLPVISPRSWAGIASKHNRKCPICFSPNLYGDRNPAQRLFNKIKQSCSVGRRLDGRIADRDIGPCLCVYETAP